MFIKTTPMAWPEIAQVWEGHDGRRGSLVPVGDGTVATARWAEARSGSRGHKGIGVVVVSP